MTWQTNIEDYMSAMNLNAHSVEDPSYQTTNYYNDRSNRVILLFDMDSFEVQVHQNPGQDGYPRVVLNSSNRIVAASYEAKKLGINRDSCPTFFAARQRFPNVLPIRIPTRPSVLNENPRPDTRIASEATQRIKSAIKSVLSSLHSRAIFEYSSGDEFFVDITDVVNNSHNYIQELVQSMDVNDLWHNTFLYNNVVVSNPTPVYLPRRLQRLHTKRTFSEFECIEARLIFGSTIANQIIKEILDSTGYQSSVGIGANKLMAKIASGINKPGSITIVAPSGFGKFSSIVNIDDIPGLGGKTGQAIQNHFQIATMQELQYVNEEILARFRVYQNQGNSYQLIGHQKARQFLNSAHGVCTAPVLPIECPKTASVNWLLKGKQYSYCDIGTILNHLWNELVEKFLFEERYNNRAPTKIKLTIEIQNGDNINSTIDVSPYNRHINRMTVLQVFFHGGFHWSEYNQVNSIHFVASF